MRDPRALISTSELAALLGDPTLRVYECTTTTTVPPPPGSDVPYVAVPGLPAFEAAHIPGADFLDIQGEFSDQSTQLRFMMPSIPQLEAAFGLIVHVDDRTLNLQDFGRLLRTFAGWGMRISFVPKDRIADQPDIIIREPEDGDA
jgi:thiosulfate/3-mercaptopyruvate sulfurtransferase